MTKNLKSMDEFNNMETLDWLPKNSFTFNNDYVNIDDSLIQYYLVYAYKYAACYSSDPRTNIGACVLVPRKQSKIKKKFINIAQGMMDDYHRVNFYSGGWLNREYHTTKYRAFYGTNNWMGPRTENHDEVLNSPKKYYYMEHAERDVISKVQDEYTNEELRRKESIMIGTCLACADCARAIIHSNIKIIFCHASPLRIMAKDNKWRESIIAAFEMFKSYGICVNMFDQPIFYTPKILMSGNLFDPSKPSIQS